MLNDQADSTNPPSARRPLRVFLDTEFVEADGDVAFISIGLVSERRHEFYAEVPASEADRLLAKHPNGFVQDAVRPQLGVVQGAPWSELPCCLAMWFESLGASEIEVIYDFNADFLLIEQMQALLDRPPSVLLNSTHVGYLLADPDGERAAANCWRVVAWVRGLALHHALADAYALRARFEAVHPPVEKVEQRMVEVLATVTVLIPEFELVHAETSDGITLAIGEGVEGVTWQTLQVGQRLRCIAEVGNWSRVISAQLVPPMASTPSSA